VEQPRRGVGDAEVGQHRGADMLGVVGPQAPLGPGSISPLRSTTRANARIDSRRSTRAGWIIFGGNAPHSAVPLRSGRAAMASRHPPSRT
jgi:hypothetical protein